MAGNLLFKRTDTGGDITTAGSEWILVDPAWLGGADAQAIGVAYKEGEFLLVSAAEEYSVVVASVVITTTYDMYLTLNENPIVTGTHHTADTLTTTDGDWTGDGSISFTYQWRTNTLADLTGTDAELSGEVTNAYVIQAGDVGLYIYCVVSASDDDNTFDANSNAVGPALNP